MTKLRASVTTVPGFVVAMFVTTIGLASSAVIFAITIKHAWNGTFPAVLVMLLGSCVALFVCYRTYAFWRGAMIEHYS